ncbi:MAG: hypothetical protein IK083_01675 [Abditibacteriota bacterium]|nr:hypothetical protein [Abditibacteriota bacterium]
MFFILLISLAVILSGRAYARVFKGQLHLHTNLSDGDGDPDLAARTYGELGFDFAAFSDHSVYYDPALSVKRKPEGLLLLGAQELSFMCRNRMGTLVPFHANAIGIHAGIRTEEIRDSLARQAGACVTDTLAAGGIPMLNHPNFRYAYSFDEILHITEPYLMEVINMHSGVPNEGSPAFPSHERIWDTLLTAGRTVYGTGTDDAHVYDSSLRHRRNSPGMAWIMLEAESLTEENVLSSLRRGAFYSTTGPELESCLLSRDRASVRLKDADRSYRIEFIGRHGALLKASTGPEAEYEIKGDEMYVRIKAYDTGGNALLTQPVFLDGRQTVIE